MNKNLKSFFCAVAIILVLSVGVRASEKQKSQTVTIQTSAICETCKARLEKKLKAVDGVEEAMLNLNNKKIKIKFDPTKTNAIALREIIASTGYDADALKKNAEAFEKLPQCCQKPME
ncbi:MAG: heavy metal-associated domain-containing protein [Bacteroidetes bacterium]|nr:heavy metal-associated domain-containing protein [Bacteroidota bacterium]